METPLALLKIVGFILHLTAPSWNQCERCAWPMKYTERHTTYYATATVYEGAAPEEAREVPVGMFPLCQDCWAVLTPKDRLPFYRALWEKWGKAGATTDEAEWEMVERAVLAGK